MTATPLPRWWTPRWWRPAGFPYSTIGKSWLFCGGWRKNRGLILLTDPDGAGFVIRNYLKGAIPRQQVKQAYIPDVAGKERRKRRPGKEGKLGVEGMRPEVLLEALRRCGATFQGEEAPVRSAELTKADMMEKGLVGPGSAAGGSRC